MDFEETSEHQMLREAVSSIAAKYGHAYFVDQARSGGKVAELWGELAKAGYIGVGIPEQWGGGGMGIYELSIVCEELAAQGTPILLLVVSPAVNATLIERFGTDDQRSRWLPRFADGSMKMAFAITEPDAGSNSHNISTAATKDGDVYRLNGTKYYISGCDEAEAVLVVARTGADEQTGRGKLSLFVVDLDAPGVTYTPIPVEMTAPEKQFTVFFDNVEVPASRLLGAEHEGLREVFFGLNPERIMTSAIGVGIGRYALSRASEYARNRSVWGMPIGSHQAVSHPLAKAKIELEQAKLMLQKAAWAYDREKNGADGSRGSGVDTGEAANMAKYAGAEAAITCLDAAIQTHGGNGMASEYGLATLMGNARLLRTAPVSREMILNFVAQHSLDLPKGY